MPNGEKVFGNEDPSFSNAYTSGGINDELPKTWSVFRKTTEQEPEEIRNHEKVLTIRNEYGELTEGSLESMYPNYTFEILRGNFLIKSPAKYNVTVDYYRLNDDGTRTLITPSFSKDYSEGDEVKVTKDVPSGYAAKITRTSTGSLTDAKEVATTEATTISGTIGDADVTYEVVYTLKPFKLTIHFQVLGEENIAAEIERLYSGGEKFSILRTDKDIPMGIIPAGYVLVEKRDVVMPNNNMTTTVYIVPEGYVFIDEDPTALGINNAALGSGEIIE